MASTFGRIVDTAGKLIDLSTRLDSNPAKEKAGGYAVWGPGGASGQLFSCEVGTIRGEAKRAKYRALSLEKALRVQSDFLRDPFTDPVRTTVSSWQTRDEEMRRYGGAVFFGYTGADNTREFDVISFSGSTEIVDQSISLLVGRELRLTNPQFVDRVMSISGGWEVYSELFGAYEGR